MPSDVADFHGRLSFENRLAAVLEQIVERPQENGISILRLTDDASNRVGEIVLQRGKYVCGAVLREKSSGKELCTGYDALRLVCGIASAEYVYLTIKQKFKGDLNLNIELKTMIKLLPNLPEDRTHLQNDEFVLNRIFATTTTRERIPSMAAPSADMSGDGWKAAGKTPMTPWTDDARRPDVNGTENQQLPTLEERAQQEIGNVDEPSAPQLTPAQKLLQKPAYFAINVVTATAQVTKVAAIAAGILLVIGGVVYTSRHVFQVRPAPPQQHLPAPAIRPATASIRHTTKVYAVRKPAPAATVQTVSTYAPSGGASNTAPPPALPTGATPHRRAYQTYP